MGVFATVSVDESIDLPHFPEELDHTDIAWQSKQGLDVYGGPYRVTGDGRLEKKHRSYREKKLSERQSEAEKWGFDSWDSYVRAYEENDDGIYPDEVDYDSDEEDDHPPIHPRVKVVDETWWGDCNHHGSFEFHQSIKRDPISWKEEETVTGGTMERVDEYALDVYLEYEARFTKGDLDEIVFMGERMPHTDNPIEEALRKIEEWREEQE